MIKWDVDTLRAETFGMIVSIVDRKLSNVFVGGCPFRAGANRARQRTGWVWLGIAVVSCAISPPSVAQQERGGAAAQQSLPSIECPLHKAGIDPAKLRPFEEVEKYIEFLERPDRAEWQKPDEVIRALGLTGRETVADLGAGSGYFTFRLARMLPEGRVFAIDSDPEMIRHLHRKARSEGFGNVIAQLTSAGEPQLSPGVDLVFVCDVLMHVRDKSAWVTRIHDQMSDNSRLVLIDFKEGKLPEGPPEQVKVPKAELLRICRQAGFELLVDDSSRLPYQNFLLFRRLARGLGNP